MLGVFRQTFRHIMHDGCVSLSSTRNSLYLRERCVRTHHKYYIYTHTYIHTACNINEALLEWMLPSTNRHRLLFYVNEWVDLQVANEAIAKGICPFWLEAAMVVAAYAELCRLCVLSHYGHLSVLFVQSPTFHKSFSKKAHIIFPKLLRSIIWISTTSSMEKNHNTLY